LHFKREIREIREKGEEIKIKIKIRIKSKIKNGIAFDQSVLRSLRFLL